MARIRTIKPEFFRHAALFDAERASGFPLRLAYAGLWTVADREGRFRWQPRALKLDCLPYDECDFSAVLSELAGAGLIVKYESGGEMFAHIPSWTKHQVINQREAQSKIPAPSNQVPAQARTETHVHARGEKEKEKEKEGEGEGEKGEVDSRSIEADRPARAPRPKPKQIDLEEAIAVATTGPSCFEQFWLALPRREGPNPRSPAEKKFNALVKTGIPADVLIAGARKAAEAAKHRGDTGSRFIPQAITWLNQQRWADAAAELFSAATGSPSGRPLTEHQQRRRETQGILDDLENFSRGGSQGSEASPRLLSGNTGERSQEFRRGTGQDVIDLPRASYRAGG